MIEPLLPGRRRADAAGLDDAERRVLDAALRSHFPTFVWKVFNTLCPGQQLEHGLAIEAIAHLVAKVIGGEERRVIINMPPRSLKSIIISVALPAFLLGLDPKRRIVCVSYSAELAKKMSNDFRAIVQSSWYRRVFPNTRIDPSKNTESEIQFTQRGVRLAVSVGGTLTGRGGDLIIVDDPMKATDAHSQAARTFVNDWFLNTLLSRLDNKLKAAILVVMQRLHIDDLTGFLLAGHDRWTHLTLAAIAEGGEIVPIGDGKVYERLPGGVLWPQREPLSVLESLRQQLGSDVFSAQYQQAPVPPGGAMIKRHWIKRYESPPHADSPWIVQSWDTAMKGGPDNDWSVCTTWLRIAHHQWYLIDVWRGRVDYPTLKKKVVELANQFKAREVLVEESGTAIGLLAELCYEVSGLIAIKPDKSKIARMSVVSAKFEAGQVFLPENAPWLAVLEAELFSFPASQHDDQVDSISQALQHDDGGLYVWLLLAGH